MKIGARKVFSFGIDDKAHQRNETAWSRLFADIKAVCPSDVAAVYAITISNRAEVARQIVRDFFSMFKANGHRRSQDNKRTSQVLYVGSSSKVVVRLREHLGICSRHI